ncbi:MAG: cysteine--tRNA ligase [bacterium]
MKIYNTLSRTIEEFVPQDGRNVRMYTCGPTVYNFAHIGNFRAYMFEDLLRRYLKFSGFKVIQVMNLTDVDDKTIKGALREKVSLDAFTRTYKDAFFVDLKALDIEPAEVYPAATGHIPEMVALIQRLMDKGFAYKSDDGSIYFEIARFKSYGKLAHIDVGGLRSGARVVQDEYDKENASDFALWKAWDESDGEIAWDSPWGRGRPGWHIECSAMGMKYLGESFDLHTGGLDNMFPHHENEIAQSEAATGKPFVKYWMHCGYLVVNGRKMSKSLGNFHTLRDILGKGYNGREMRYVLLSAHYRQPLNFTMEALDSARSALMRVDEFAARLIEKAGTTGVAAGQLPVWAEQGRSRFVAALDEDLATPEAMGAIFDMIHAGNRAMNAGEVGSDSARAVLGLIDDLDRVLGFLKKPEETADANVLRLVDAREVARKAKDWKASDGLRDEIAALGWIVKDTPQGQKLRKKETLDSGR